MSGTVNATNTTPPTRSITTGSSTCSVSSPLLPRVAAGSVGAVVTALAVTPLEVVKVRQQSSLGTSSVTPNLGPPPSGVSRCPRGCGTFVLNNGLMDCVLPKSAVPYFDRMGRPARTACLRPATAAAEARSAVRVADNAATAAKTDSSAGTFTLLRRIFRAEGIGGIYAGLTPTLVMSVPNTVLYFASYDEIVSRLRRRQRMNGGTDADSAGRSRFDTVAVPLIGGSSARMLATAATSPLELLRTRQASVVGTGSAGSSRPSMVSEFRMLIRSEGFLSLYKGLGPTLWRDVPFSAIYWLFLEQFKNRLAQSDGILGGKVYKDRGEDIPPLLQAGHAFVSGAGSGMIAAFATTPFDVVKTRRQMVQQAQSVATGAEAAVICDHGGAVVYKPPFQTADGARPVGTFGYMRHIVQLEGVSGLWRGNQTRMIKVAPACAIMISCYELGKRILE